MRSWFSRTSACVFRTNSSLYAAQRARTSSSPLNKNAPRAKRDQTVMSLSTSAVSDVVKAARELFSNRNHARELTADDVQGVLESLGQITVANVGLAKQAEEERKRSASIFKNKLPFFDKNKSSPPITYFHIYECPDFTVGIFCIPENRDMPLHDHPQMTVCSKVLYGEVRVEAYDKAPELEGAIKGGGGGDSSQNSTTAMFARKTKDDVVTEETGPFALFSKKRNIHKFSAVSSCAILDVLGPPYSPSEGREIAYYQEARRIQVEGEGNNDEDNGGGGVPIVLLEQVNPPTDYVVEGREYTGQKVEA